MSQRFESLPNRERYRVKQRAGERCQLCGDREASFSYHDVGADDWVMLCSNCHRLVHPRGRPGIRITRQTIDQAAHLRSGLVAFPSARNQRWHEDDQ